MRSAGSNCSATLRKAMSACDGLNHLLTEDYLDAFARAPDVTYHYAVETSEMRAVPGVCSPAPLGGIVPTFL